MPYGSTDGLPGFVELYLIFIEHGQPVFAVKRLVSWYSEHLRAWELEYTRQVTVLERQEFTDFYPLTAYVVNGRRFVTLKHHIQIP